MSRSVLVLGAGMVGVCCALALQKRGFSVALLDRREPGSETSYGNAGIVSGSSILPLNNPGLWKALPSYLGNRHAAVRFEYARGCVHHVLVQHRLGRVDVEGALGRPQLQRLPPGCAPVCAGFFLHAGFATAKVGE